jgi:toxin ParE1/3/4
MPYRVELSARAKRDLTEIDRFIGADQSETAARWLTGFREALRSLSSMPQRFPATAEQSALRHLLYGNKPHIYRAIYSINEEQQRVIIITIRHGARAPLRR